MRSEQANKDPGRESEQGTTSHPEGYSAIGEVESFISLRESACHAQCEDVLILPEATTYGTATVTGVTS
eukprot:2096453-Rhodomonas_salina.1